MTTTPEEGAGQLSDTDIESTALATGPTATADADGTDGDSTDTADGDSGDADGTDGGDADGSDADGTDGGDADGTDA